jgi:hypothetical protein
VVKDLPKLGKYAPSLVVEKKKANLGGMGN